MSEESHGWDGTLKLGGTIGVFFLLQSYGYALGRAPADAKPASSILEAVGFGVAHLSNIFLFGGDVAWPLGPTLCGVLILYALHLPSQLRSSAPETLVANRLFASLIIAVTLTTVGGFLAQAIRYPFPIERYLQGVFATGIVRSCAYVVLLSFWTYAAHLALSHWPQWTMKLRRPPWAEIVGALCIAWLLGMSFLGAHFDGTLDALTGACGLPISSVCGRAP